MGAPAHLSPVAYAGARARGGVRLGERREQEMMKERTYTVKAAYGRVTVYLGSRLGLTHFAKGGWSMGWSLESTAKI